MNFGIDILCVQETKLKNSGKIMRDGYTLLFSGHSSMRQEGVGIILNNNLAKQIFEISVVSSRIIWIIIKNNAGLFAFFSIMLVQVNMRWI